MIARVLFSTTLIAATLLTAGCGNSARISEESPKDWVCTAGANNEWDCQWRYTDSGEPFKPVSDADSNTPDVEQQSSDQNMPAEQSQSTPSADAASNTAAVASTTVATAVVISDEQQVPSPLTREKLEASPDDYYVVQLATFTQQSSVTQYTTFYRQLEPLTLVTPSDKFLLLENVYPDYSSAKAAVEQYPTSDKIEQPWIRKVSELKALLSATS